MCIFYHISFYFMSILQSLSGFDVIIAIRYVNTGKQSDQSCLFDMERGDWIFQHTSGPDQWAKSPKSQSTPLIPLVWNQEFSSRRKWKKEARPHRKTVCPLLNLNLQYVNPREILWRLLVPCVIGMTNLLSLHLDSTVKSPHRNQQYCHLL